MCLRLLRRSVIVSQSYRTAASSPKAPHKNCEKRRVFPIPGSRTSFSNLPEPRESKILLRPCADENPCTPRVCQDSNALAATQHPTELSLKQHNKRAYSYRD